MNMRNKLSAIAVTILLGASLVACGQEGGGNGVPGLTTPTVDDGAAAYQRGDFTTALTLFRALAEQGGVQAQYNMGVMHYMGQGTAQDYVEAVRWYRMASDAGGPRAQFNLGLMYENGEGVTQDRAEAVRLYRLAGELGHPGAVDKIAEVTALIAETGNAPDALLDASLAQEAVEQLVEAPVEIAPVEIAEAPVPPEPIVEEEPEAEALPPEALALAALTMAPATDAAPPPVEAPPEIAPVATMADAQAAYERGDFANAVSQYQELAVQGEASAQYTLAVMYANGQGVDQDEAQAIRYYSMAADQGHAAAQFDLGSMYANGQGVAADDLAAMRFYRLAANQGHGAAQINFSQISGAKFFEASAAYQAADYATAFSTYQLLADYGDAAAQHNLGLMYENGLGVGQNMEQAMRWYRLAADQAFPPAVTRLNTP
jgi:TPR repeat protein